jgi:hypothetical protein
MFIIFTSLLYNQIKKIDMEMIFLSLVLAFMGFSFGYGFGRQRIQEKLRKAFRIEKDIGIEEFDEICEKHNI